MDFSCRVNQLLHEEHMSTIEMLNGLESVLASAGRGAPDVNTQPTRNALQTAISLINREVGSHFSFEEEELFPRLAEYGDAEIGEHLTQEHRAILPNAQTVSKLAEDALTTGFNDDTWKKFRGEAGELIERMLSHIQKEEMALLPVLEDVLDAEADFALSEAHANQ